jgi:competence protein ComEA
MIRILISLGLTVVAAAQTLPDGPGKDVVQKMCTPCHTLSNVVKARMTKERWAAVVDDMVARGAEGTDDEIGRVIDYLAANFAAKRVNVNRASPADLVSSLGLTASDADAIVRYRTDKGKFKELQDLMKVPGVDSKKIAASKDSIEF